MEDVFILAPIQTWSVDGGHEIIETNPCNPMFLWKKLRALEEGQNMVWPEIP
jgi:hypothetical protein